MDQEQMIQRIIDLTEDMISQEGDLIVSARELVQLGICLGISNHPAFLPIVGFESETEAALFGPNRQLWNSDYLKELDEDIERFVSLARPSLIQHCQDLVAYLRGLQKASPSK